MILFPSLFSGNSKTNNLNLDTKSTPDKKNPFSDVAFFGISSDRAINTSTKIGQLQAYSQLGTISACVDAIARDSFKPFYIFDHKGKQIDLSTLDPELATLLQYKYNSDNLQLIIKKHIIPHLLLSGNAFLWKSTNTLWGKSNIKFDSLIPVNPANVEILLDPLAIFITGYRVTLQGQQVVVPEKDMIHFKQNTILSPCIGIGNIEKAKYTCETESQSDIFQKSFIKNRATPSIAILDPKDMTPEDAARNKSILTSTFAGEDNAGKLLYIPNAAGVTVETLQISQKDQQFIEQKTFNRQTMMSIFGVPSVVLGIPDGSNKAIAQTMYNNYLNVTINSLLQELSETFTSQLISQYYDNYRLEFEQYTKNDTDEISKQFEKGIIYRNEARASLGYTEIKGDELIVDPTANSFAGMMSEDNIASKSANVTNNKSNVTMSQKKADREKAYHMVSTWKKSSNAMNAKWTKELQDFLAEQGKRVVEKLNGKKAVFDAKVLFAGEDELLKEQAYKLHISALTRGINDVNLVYGLSVDNTTKNPFVNTMATKLGQLITRVNDTTREEIVKVLNTGLEESQTVNEIAGRIGEKYSEMIGYRARMIARTETRMAYMESQKNCFQEMGTTTMSIMGCEFIEDGYDCNLEGFPMDYSPNLHINCTGTIVADN